MTYSVKEIFLTLQGEGARTGAKSVFLRFAGCNLWNGRPEDRDKGKGACARWCDTDFAKGEQKSLTQLLVEADKLWPYVGQTRWMVVTGGEPMLQLDGDFLLRFREAGWAIAVESNGTIEAHPEIDWLTVSPKRGGELKQFAAHELKVVLPGEVDGIGWADDELEAIRKAGQWKQCFVQPQDVILPSKTGATYLTKSLLGAEADFKKNLKRCIDFVYEHPQWSLSFQTHKIEGLR